eukprot:2711173-Alexandrium_andersonii.AAC.1
MPWPPAAASFALQHSELRRPWLLAAPLHRGARAALATPRPCRARQAGRRSRASPFGQGRQLPAPERQPLVGGALGPRLGWRLAVTLARRRPSAVLGRPA